MQSDAVGCTSSEMNGKSHDITVLLNQTLDASKTNMKGHDVTTVTLHLRCVRDTERGTVILRFGPRPLGGGFPPNGVAHPAAARCNMVLHRAFRARHVRKTASAVRCDMVLHRAFSARHP